MAAEFVLFEDADTTSTLYDRIVPGHGGGEDPVVPEPTGLGLAGLALMVLRKRRGE